MTSTLDDTPTDDLFLGGRLRLLQPGKGHRAGLDAVMLAAATAVLAGEHVLDVGCGTGVVGLCIASRIAGTRVTGIEIDPTVADLARENARRNGLADRVAVVTGDVRAPEATLVAQGLVRESFDVVVSNPPFLAADRGTGSPRPDRRRASQMAEAGLDEWLRFMAAMARPGGRLALVYDAAALAEVLAALEGRFGDIAVLPLHPTASAPALRVIMLARKGSRAPLRLLPGLVVHRDDRGFTDAAERILRHGEALNVR